MDRKQRWHLAAVILVCLVAIRGCGTDDTFTAVPPPPDDVGAICSHHPHCQQYCSLGLTSHMAPYCTRSCDAELPCPAGYQCVSQGQMGMVCQMTFCQSVAECPEGFSCDTEHGVCDHGDIPCTVDDDCPAATACNQGVCAVECTSAADCKQGYLCDHEQGCVQCIDHGTCSEGFACVQGFCNTACVREEDCRPGYRCNAAAVCEQIVGDGDTPLGESCDEHEECEFFCHHHHSCSMPCDPAAADSCPSGYQCLSHEWMCTPE